MNDTKTWWQSRTIWANIVATLFALLAGFKVLPTGLDQETVLTTIMGAIAVVNVLLRISTKTAIG
jgi:hypothetical protein